MAGAVKLLRDSGPQRVTIEAVSTETGVAKTSIYRRYNNSSELLEAALDQVRPADFDLSEHTSWEAALISVLSILFQDMGQGVALSLLEDPNSPTATVLRRKVLRPRTEALRGLLEREVARGEVRPDVDLDVLIDFVLGAGYVHVARYGHLDSAWPHRVYETLSRLLSQQAVTEELFHADVPGQLKT